MTDPEDRQPISPDDLDQIVGHLQAEEAASREATLNSLESFQLWVMTHPALRNSALAENLAQIAPALFTAIRRLLGM